MYVEALECRRHFSVVIMADANGDGKIDGSDYSLIDNGFNTHVAGWQNGDFNGDGRVDGTDYSLIDNAFVTQGTITAKTYAVRPGDKIQDVADIIQPGDTMDILPGTYSESVNLLTMGLSDTPIIVHGFDQASTIIDGMGQPFAWNSGSYTNIDGLTFNGAANALQVGGVIIGLGSTMSNCTIQNCDAAGLEMRGSFMTITNVTAQYNGEIGFKAAGCSNINLYNCVSRYNNTGMVAPNWAGQAKTVQVNGLWYVSPQFEAGGGKFAYADSIFVDGLECYGNIGHQFDFDINDSHITVQNSSFHDAGWIDAVYEAMGLNIELSNGPVLVQNNTFTNDRGNGLFIQTGSNVGVYNNTFSDKANIGLSNWSRGTDWSLSNIEVSGNTMSKSQLVTDGNSVPWDENATTVMSLYIHDNTWINVPANNAVQWDTLSLSIDDARSFLEIS